MKKAFRAALSAALSIALVCAFSMSYFAYAANSGFVSFGSYVLNYSSSNNPTGVTITGYTGVLPSELNIPASLDGHTVTKIGENAFSPNYSGCSIQKLSIPASVTEIEDAGFAFCQSLTEVSFSEGLKIIGNFSFMSCSSLSAIALPASLESISVSFAGCGLKTIIVSPRNLYFTAVDNVLFSKDMAVLYQYPLGLCSTSYTMPDSVTEIASASFGFSELQKVQFSSNLEYIGINAFADSKIVSANFPASLKNIDMSAFSRCTDLKSAAFLSSDTVISEYAFNECNNFIIRGYKNSTAEAFANSQSKTFKIIDTDNINLALGVPVSSLTYEYSPSEYNVSVKDCYGAELTETQTAGTGTKISVKDLYGTTAAEKLVYVTGDINGDGAHDINDYNTLIDAAICRTQLPDNIATLSVSDANGDGVIDFFDVAQYDLYLNSLS